MTGRLEGKVAIITGAGCVGPGWGNGRAECVRFAQEGAKKGITVNVVAPGYIDTDMVRAVPEKVLESIIATIPTGRLGKAEEIASMCAYLSSEEAAFINGATMTVNGAQYIAG